MLKKLIEKLIRREDLSRTDMQYALSTMLEQQNEAQIASFL